MCEYFPVEFENIVTIDKLYTVHYFCFEPTHKRIDEQHDFWELVYVDKNEAYICTSEEKLLLHEGEIILHAPNVIHGIEGNGTTGANIGIVSFSSPSIQLYCLEHRVLTPNTAQRNILRNILREGYLAFGVQLDMSKTRSLITRSDAPIGCLQMISLYLQQLLILMLRNIPDRYTEDTSRQMENKQWDEMILSGVIKLMHDHLQGELSLPEICRFAGIGETVLKLRFRARFGCGVMTYYRQLRMEEARRLLREGKLNITQIAEHMGFSSSHYFSACFKKMMGMSPTQYIHSIHPK